MDRAPGYGPEGCGFNSCRVLQLERPNRAISMLAFRPPGGCNWRAFGKTTNRWRRMAGWVGRRIARAPENQRGDSAALVGLVVLAVALAFHGYKHWRGEPRIGGAWYKHWDAKPLVGAALVVDGDSLEISGARIRLTGIDAPEMRQTCTDARR